MDTARRMKPLLPTDPSLLGRYRLLGRLGSGGMGVVYLVETPDGSLAAIKLLHAMYAGDEEFLGRFRSEVNRARQVPASCTAQVLDADLDHSPPFLVVEFVDGPSLGDFVEERGRLTGERLHAVAVGVATALTGIHGAGVIHRDLKPDNVLLAPGGPKLIDFGIAKAFEATSRHTRTDQFVGTVAYMAPERFDNEPGVELTPAADVFAWGCIVAFAATGRTPFHGDTPTVTAARILTQPPYLEGLEPSLRALVERALAKNPARRPTAAEVLKELSLASRAGHSRAGHSRGGRREATRRQARNSRRAQLRGVPALIGAGLALAGLATALVANGSLQTPADTTDTPVAAGEAAGGPDAEEARAGAIKPSPATSATRGAKPPPVKASGLNLQARLERFMDEDPQACEFQDVQIVMSASSSGSYPCGVGTDEEDLREQSVTVTAASFGGDACVGYWFHWFDAAGGDLIRMCREEITVGVAKFGNSELYGRLVVPSPPPLSERFKTRADIRENSVTFYRDDHLVGTIRLNEESPKEGRSVLGMVAQAERGAPPFRAVVFDVDVVRL